MRTIMRGTVRGAASRHAGLSALVTATVLALAACSAVTESGTTNSAPEGPGTPLLGPSEFATAAEGRLLLNVHTPDEGSIPGTDASVPFDELQTRTEELPADLATPLAVYCMTDRMSAIAVQTLADMGYQDLVELDGGMVAWERAFPDAGAT